MGKIHVDHVCTVPDTTLTSTWNPLLENKQYWQKSSPNGSIPSAWCADVSGRQASRQVGFLSSRDTVTLDRTGLVVRLSQRASALFQINRLLSYLRKLGLRGLSSTVCQLGRPDWSLPSMEDPSKGFWKLLSV